MLLYLNAIPQPVNRVGYFENPWSLADWKYGPFDGRWDDPRGTYRVRYVAFGRFGAFVERTVRYRSSLAVLESLNTSAGSVPVPGLPNDWFQTNTVGTAIVDYPSDNGLIDFATAEGIAAAHAAIAAASRASGHRLTDYDASTLLGANPRRFTQELSRYVYDAGFAGVVYRSRFAPDEFCAALFEGRHDVRDDCAVPIERDDADLLRACDLHHIPHPPIDVPRSIRPVHF